MLRSGSLLAVLCRARLQREWCRFIRTFALLIFNGLFAGYIALQYADLQSAYPAEMIGRALSVFTMAMFLGVAALQWGSGLAASIALTLDMDPLRVALLSICTALAIGALAFWRLPWPPNLRRSPKSPNLNN